MCMPQGPGEDGDAVHAAMQQEEEAMDTLLEHPLDILERLCEQVALLDTSDLNDLAELHTGLECLSHWS